jgi:hypothetical protein
VNFYVRELTTANTVQHILHRDYETRGVLQLKDVGAWKYAADEHTEVLCCAFCVDDKPVKLWLPGDPVPEEFLEAARDPSWLVCAHNAQFELAIEHLIMRRRYGWPKIPLQQQRCTMATALALALPARLELVAEALDLLHQKDRAGQRLMLMMTKPRRPRKDEDPDGRYYFDDEERRQRLYQYCRRDVEIERELYRQLRPLSPEERRDEPYCITACKIFRVPDGSFNDASPERKVGKTCDLAFGYQGGLAAWRKFEPDRFTDAEVEQFKSDWRAAHPQINTFWYAIDRAARQAVRQREYVIRCGKLLLKCTGMFLFIKLPSGRKLAYPFPRIATKDLKHHEAVVFKDASSGQWRDCRGGSGAYGGLWAENIVSGISRDLLAAALLRLERAGYRIILHVHDEAVGEVPIGFGSIEEFRKLMTVSPSWAVGPPITAKAWSGPRFCKT